MYPIKVEETTFINLIKNNYQGFDNIDNYHAQNTSYFLQEIEKE